MNKSNGITVKFFGIFRDLCNASSLNFEVTSVTTVSDLKGQIESKIRELNPQYLKSNDVGLLLSRSILADETRLLSQNEVLKPGMDLAILPPVCGG